MGVVTSGFRPQPENARRRPARCLHEHRQVISLHQYNLPQLTKLPQGQKLGRDHPATLAALFHTPDLV